MFDSHHLLYFFVREALILLASRIPSYTKSVLRYATITIFPLLTVFFYRRPPLISLHFKAQHSPILIPVCIRTDEYIDTVEKRTGIRNDITPYEIYLKILYEYFMDEINADKDLLAEDLFPDGYMRLQYQIDAVVRAKKILAYYMSLQF